MCYWERKLVDSSCSHRSRSLTYNTITPIQSWVWTANGDHSSFADCFIIHLLLPFSLHRRQTGSVMACCDVTRRFCWTVCVCWALFIRWAIELDGVLYFAFAVEIAAQSIVDWQGLPCHEVRETLWQISFIPPVKRYGFSREIWVCDLCSVDDKGLTALVNPHYCTITIHALHTNVYMLTYCLST